jgi:NAD(P)-dependent dehydrogenase (short-subunit alcohol dehydrogenase family)
MGSEPPHTRNVARLFDLTGKVAVVTGGSRGLGRSISLAYAEAGADVVVTSRDIETCKEVARGVEALGRKALPFSCHVGRWEQLPGLVQAAYDTFGRIDILVNNAGKSPLYPTLMDVSEQMWESVFDINLKGSFRLATLIGTRMYEGDGGSIINVSSIGSVRPDAHIVPYSAAKAGLNAMTIALSKAWGPKVRVNCIMPGAFLTDVTKAWDMPAHEARWKESLPMRRGGDPDEIVGAALYFASDAASYTTGVVMAVDGGAM